MADSWGRRVSKGCPHETLVPLGWRACGHTRGGQMGSTAAVELSPTQWHRSLFGVLYSAQVFTHRPQRTSLLPGATGSGAPLPSPALALVSVVLAEDPVVLQVEEVAHTEPVLALSTRKALQVVDIGAALMTISKAGITWSQAAQSPGLPNSLWLEKGAAVSGRALHSAQRDTHLR